MKEWSTQTKVLGPTILLVGFVMLLCGISLCVLSWKLANENHDHSFSNGRTGGGENNNTFQYYYGGNDRCTSQASTLKDLETKYISLFY